MQSSRTKRQRTGATRPHHVSLDLTDGQDVLDLKLLEAIQRIERVHSKAMAAVGTLIAEA